MPSFFFFFGKDPYYTDVEENNSDHYFEYNFLHVCLVLGILWCIFVLFELDLIRRNMIITTTTTTTTTTSSPSNLSYHDHVIAHKLFGSPKKRERKRQTPSSTTQTATPSSKHPKVVKILKHNGPLKKWESYETFSSRYVQKHDLPTLGMTSVPISVGSFVKPSGRRRALIIGINYTDTPSAELYGCHNDAHNIKKMLIRDCGFPNDSSHMVVLTDTPKQDPNYLPTYSNIFKAMKWLTENVVTGDVLFFHFSGHGGQIPDSTGYEVDGLNETIVPMDYYHSSSHQITDDELWSNLVYPLPAGVRLTALMDCCHSGTGMDLPYEYVPTTRKSKQKNGLFRKKSTGKSNQWTTDVNAAHSQGDVVLFSGCRDYQTSADVYTKSSTSSLKTGKQAKAGGAMTMAFLGAYETILSNYNKKEDLSSAFTYPVFLKLIHAVLKQHEFTQIPQLTSSQPFNLQERIFSLVDDTMIIEPNHNDQIGRMKQKHFKPRVPGQEVGFMDKILYGA